VDTTKNRRNNPDTEIWCGAAAPVVPDRARQCRAPTRIRNDRLNAMPAPFTIIPMKWLKRLLKGLAALLILLLLAAIGFREWCVWRLPRMRAEVNAAWKDYAGVALDNVPKKFPPVETNEAALNLEKAAAKLGICLAPKKTDEKCPRNAPAEDAIKDYESLNVKGSKGEDTSLLIEYLNSQMEKADPDIDPPPAGLKAYLENHDNDLNATAGLMNEKYPPVWEFRPTQHDALAPNNYPGQIKLFRLLVVQSLVTMSQRTPTETEVILEALDRQASSLLNRPDGVPVLIAVAERRQLITVMRKFQLIAPAWMERMNWGDLAPAQKFSAVYSKWQMTTPESVQWFELVDGDWQAGNWPVQTKNESSLSQRFIRPWHQLSFLQLNLAAIHDMKSFDAVDRCQSNLSWESIPGFSIPEAAWYKPKWYVGYTGIIKHPELSWWNPVGKIIYAIGGPPEGEWKRINRFLLESELTQKVLKLRAVRKTASDWPSSIPGIESSICKNEKWNYAVNPDGSASLTFSGKPDWGRGMMRNANVPLYWTEPAPGK
jgi:hypothetical protein